MFILCRCYSWHCIIFLVTLFSCNFSLYSSDADSLTVQQTTRPQCDTDSLCGAHVFNTNRPDKVSYIYFSKWKFPDGIYPNLTAQCPSLPDSCESRTTKSDAICLVDRRGWWNSLPLLQHFPHAAEVLLPCWNYFSQCIDTAKSNLFVLTNLSQPVEHLLQKSDWIQSFLKMTHITVQDVLYYEGNHTDGAAFTMPASIAVVAPAAPTGTTGTTETIGSAKLALDIITPVTTDECSTIYVKGDRFLTELLNNWGVGFSAVGKLREAFDIPLTSKKDNRAIHIAVLNRKGRRQIDNALDLLAHIDSKSSWLLDTTLHTEQRNSGDSDSGIEENSTVLINYESMVTEHITMDGLTLKEQIAWMSSKDIIITSHGAQNTNLAFLRPCSVVMEAYTPEFFTPEYYMPLITMVGGIGFTLVDLPRTDASPYEGIKKLKDVEDRRRARNPHVVLDVPVVVEHVLPRLISAHKQCLQQRRTK